MFFRLFLVFITCRDPLLTCSFEEISFFSYKVECIIPVRSDGRLYDAAMIVRRVLPNGLRVVVDKVPDVRSVAVGVWVDVGSRHENDGVFGVSHFLEHLLFKGTEKWQANDIARELDAVGGEFNAFTAKDLTGFYVRVLDDALPLGLEVLSEITQRPAFRADEVESERHVVLEEINMYDDMPDDMVHDLFASSMFGSHPLGRPVIGTRESITEMERAAVADYFSRQYTADKFVIAAAGNLDPDLFCEEVAARWTLASNPAEKPAMPVPLAPGSTVQIKEKTVEQVHVVVGVPGICRDDKRRHALSILNHVVGGGMSSRLFQEVREKRGLVYAVFSYQNLYQDAGYWAAYAGTMPDRVPETLTILAEQLDLLRHGITELEFDNAKSHIRGGLALSSEDTGSRMSRIGRSELSLGEVLTLDELVGRVDAVTLEEVNELAEELGSAERVVALLGPESAVSEDLTAPFFS